MISPVRPSTTSPVRPAKSTNSFSPAIWVWRIVGIFGPSPAPPGGAGPAEIAADRSLAQPQALGNRPLRQLAGKPQSQNFADLAHRHSLGRHLVPLLFGKGASLLWVENCRRRGPLYPHIGLITITGIDDHVRPESVITFHRIG